MIEQNYTNIQADALPGWHMLEEYIGPQTAQALYEEAVPDEYIEFLFQSLRMCIDKHLVQEKYYAMDKICAILEKKFPEILFVILIDDEIITTQKDRYKGCILIIDSKGGDLVVMKRIYEEVFNCIHRNKKVPTVSYIVGDALQYAYVVSCLAEKIIITERTSFLNIDKTVFASKEHFYGGITGATHDAISLFCGPEREDLQSLHIVEKYSKVLSCICTLRQQAGSQLPECVISWPEGMILSAKEALQYHFADRQGLLWTAISYLDKKILGA